MKLVTYLGKRPVLANLVFPRDYERIMDRNEFKDKIDFEERDENEHATQFLFQYIDMIEQRQQGN